MRNRKNVDSCLIKRRAFEEHNKGHTKWPDCFIGVPIIKELNEIQEIFNLGIVNNSSYQPREGA